MTPTFLSGSSLASSLPLAGATLRILGTIRTTETDAQGLFRFDAAPVGSVKLIVDGTTVLRPGPWPDLEFDLTTIPGRDNTVGMPIYLVPLDQRNGLLVDEEKGGTLTLPHIPGFALEIAPGSVIFPGGSRSGVVSVTVVHNDKIPMVPNFGQQPRFIVTIQPAGARFEPPARLTLPNIEGLKPGEVTELYSFDHDLGHFVSIGPATVSEDSTKIVSNPGVGIIKAGWHCGGNPATVGTTHACPGCTVCNGSQCVPGCEVVGGESSESAQRDTLAATAGTNCNCGPGLVCHAGQCVCAAPTNFRETTHRDLGGGFLYFAYTWDSSTGRAEDLVDCQVGEVVYFPSNPFTWPRPWTFTSSSPKGGVPSGGATQKLTDTHGAYDPPPILPPYEAASFITRQIYGFTCPCLGLAPAEIKPLVGQIIIHREVRLGPTGRWEVCITKKGVKSCGDLP